MLDPTFVTDIALSTLALHSMLSNSLDKSVYCPPGLVDSESLDGDIIYDLWRNDTPGESMHPTQCWGRGHNYSVTGKAVRDTYLKYFFNEGAVPWL